MSARPPFCDHPAMSPADPKTEQDPWQRHGWRLLVLLFLTHNLLLGWATQDATFQLINGLAWLGAALCLEAQWPTLPGRPSYGSLVIGAAVLGFISWRSTRVLNEDQAVHLLPLLTGLGLLSLAAPWAALRRFWKPLLILSLPLLNLLQPRIVDERSLSHVTAELTGWLLRLCGLTAEVRWDVEVWLPEGGVRVAGECSGEDVLVLMSMVALIFLLAFPLKGYGKQLLALVLAPLIAIAGNAVRIALLAAIHAGQWPERESLFRFLHDEAGALTFSAITMSVFAALYYQAFTRQLREAAR
ncbi:MAG: hypothetical protein RL026_1098 [Pseudomonadota bacterium]